MEESKVRIKNKSDETLVGVEVLPHGSQKKFPVVIMAHGFAYYKEEDGLFVEIGKRLAEKEIASYRFDFSGCGESEGNYADTTLTKLRDDLDSILEYVRTLSTTDVDRIGILGQSFGTTTTIALSPKVKTIVLMGSFMDGYKVLSDLFSDGYHPEGVSEDLRSDGRITKINPAFWKDFENHDMIKLLQQIHSSLLLVHGSRDFDVPISNMEEIYENANEPKEKVVIEGADHSLQPKREEVYKIVVDWLTKNLLTTAKN